MKRICLATLLAALSLPILAADVGFSLSIGEPGFYGRLDIGDYPEPRLIYRQPRMVQRSAMDRPPVYLRVPPGQRTNWRKYCGRYDACGERVYFVQDSWYQREYVPRYQERQRERGDGRRDGRRGWRDNDWRENEQRGNDHRGNNRGDRGLDNRPHGDGPGR